MSVKARLAALVRRGVAGAGPRSAQRLEMALVAVSHVWLMTGLALAIEPADRRNPALTEHGLGLSMGLTALAALGLMGFGAAMSDALRRRAGSGRRAMVRAVVGLLALMAAAAWLGPASSLVGALAAAGLLLHVSVGRYLPAAAVLGAGLLHMLVLMAPNPWASFVWPVLLAVTHVVASESAILLVGRQRGRLSSETGWAICIGWGFLSLLLVSLMRSGQSAQAAHLAWVWVGPAAAVAGFVLLSVVLLQDLGDGGQPGRWTAHRFTWLARLWLILYNATWLLSARRVTPGIAVLGLLLIALAARPALARLKLLLEPARARLPAEPETMPGGRL